ncbi:helix-turn-helix domain-containing protein [Phreatobacter sp. AB_2022a]|nr:helix-turn-helix domain-containing protein [Phreatobacter sp. AB_2022a]
MPSDHEGPITVVPDGCIDIVWRGGALHVAGPDIEAALPEPSAGTDILGLRFQPGAALHWLGVPVAELVGRQVPLADLWGLAGARLADRMGEARTATARLHAFENGVAALSADRSGPSRDMAFLFERLGRGRASLDMLCARLDISPRTLRRRSIESFGYGAKTLERILTFQRFLDLARGSPAAGLAALAEAAGYADQAHLSREVKRLSGFSPATVLCQLGC